MKKRVLYGVLAVITIFSLVGCGKKEEVKSNNEETSKSNVSLQEQQEDELPLVFDEEDELSPEEAVEYLPEETIDDIQESLNNLELYSDDTKFVVKQDDHTTGIYYHNGDVVTGYEVYVEYATAEEAKLAAQGYQLTEDDEIESFKVEGNKIHVTYKESLYEDISVEQLKQSFALIEALKEHD